MFEVIELVCGCCELGFAAADAATQRDKRKAETEEQAAARLARREEREGKRGVRMIFTGKRISDVEFLSGPAAGKRAAEMPDMELKRLAVSMPHRVARFAIRRYLRHKKRGRFSQPAPAIKR